MVQLKHTYKDIFVLKSYYKYTLNKGKGIPFLQLNSKRFYPYSLQKQMNSKQCEAHNKYSTNEWFLTDDPV